MFSYTNIHCFLKNANRPVIIRMLFIAAVFGLCLSAGSTDVKAQVAPGPKPAETKKPETGTTKGRPRPNRVQRGSPQDSYNFLLLGDRFYEKGRWNAAEAAFRESIRLWSGSEASAALKELHEATRVK